MRNRSLCVHTAMLCALLTLSADTARGQSTAAGPHAAVSRALPERVDTRPLGPERSHFSPRAGVTPLPPIHSVVASPQTAMHPAGHPLHQALEIAQHSLRQASGLRDYTCTLAKRERIHGQLTDHEYVFMKIRTRPFSVYTRSLGPTQPRGQECIYHAGRNNGQVLVHGTGWKDQFTGTKSLDPNDAWLLKSSLYPLTSAGLHNLLHKLIKLHEYESQFEEVSVRLIPQASVDDRLCTCIEVTHPEQRQSFKFHQMRTYYDDVHRLPIRFEAYSWPDSVGGEPPLVEEYTYTRLELNPGLTDADFDIRNPAYGYK